MTSELTPVRKSHWNIKDRLNQWSLQAGEGAFMYLYRATRFLISAALLSTPVVAYANDGGGQQPSSLCTTAMWDAQACDLVIAVPAWTLVAGTSHREIPLGGVSGVAPSPVERGGTGNWTLPSTARFDMAALIAAHSERCVGFYADCGVAFNYHDATSWWGGQLQIWIYRHNGLYTYQAYVVTPSFSYLTRIYGVYWQGATTDARGVEMYSVSGGTWFRAPTPTSTLLSSDYPYWVVLP